MFLITATLILDRIMTIALKATAAFTLFEVGKFVLGYNNFLHHLWPLGV